MWVCTLTTASATSTAAPAPARGWVGSSHTGPHITTSSWAFRGCPASGTTQENMRGPAGELTPTLTRGPTFLAKGGLSAPRTGTPGGTPTPAAGGRVRGSTI